MGNNVYGNYNTFVYFSSVNEDLDWKKVQKVYHYLHGLYIVLVHLLGSYIDFLIKIKN